MLDGQEGVVGGTGTQLSTEETNAAENFLIKERAANALQEQKAQIAMEDSIIARHRATTGRNFHNREKDLADALQWQATQEQKSISQAQEFIRQQQKFEEKQAPQASVAPQPKTSTLNIAQRVVGFVSNLIGRK